MTRAMRLGESWDTRLAHDLIGARAFGLEGDRLTVTLADGGAYLWRRLSP